MTAETFTSKKAVQKKIESYRTAFSQETLFHHQTMWGKCTHTRLSFLGFINVQLQVYNIVFYYNSIHPTQGCMGAGEAGYNLDSNVFQSQTHTMHAYTYTYC